MALPPQLSSETEGLDALTVHFPRQESRHPALRRRARTLFWVLWTPQLALALFYGPLLAFGSMGLSAIVAFVVWTRFIDLPEHERFTVRLDAQGLTIDDEAFGWGDLLDVRWDCTPPTTDLVLTLATGEERTFVCNRRQLGDSIGVTRKQRAWFEEKADAHIQRAGTREAVPDELAGLARRRRGLFET